MSHAWMPLSIDDYLADTRHLTTLEHGAYLLLIMRYWQKSGLPSDDRMVQRITGLDDAHWAESRDVLASFFDDGWRHSRIDAELEKAADIISKRRSAANRRHAQNKADACELQMHNTCGDTGIKPKPSTNLSDTDVSGAEAPPAEPAYTDARHELYGEGKPILLSLGVAEKQCGAMITRWLRDTGDDCGGVLDAIRRARDERVMDPIPWITRALPTRTRHDRTDNRNANRRPAEPSQFNAALARAVDRRTGGRVPPDNPGGVRPDRSATSDGDGDLLALGPPLVGR